MGCGSSTAAGQPAAGGDPPPKAFAAVAPGGSPGDRTSPRAGKLTHNSPPSWVGPDASSPDSRLQKKRASVTTLSKPVGSPFGIELKRHSSPDSRGKNRGSVVCKVDVSQAVPHVPEILERASSIEVMDENSPNPPSRDHRAERANQRASLVRAGDDRLMMTGVARVVETTAAATASPVDEALEKAVRARMSRTTTKFDFKEGHQTVQRARDSMAGTRKNSFTPSSGGRGSVKGVQFGGDGENSPMRKSKVQRRATGLPTAEEKARMDQMDWEAEGDAWEAAGDDDDEDGETSYTRGHPPGDSSPLAGVPSPTALARAAAGMAAEKPASVLGSAGVDVREEAAAGSAGEEPLATGGEKGGADSPPPPAPAPVSVPDSPTATPRPKGRFEQREESMSMSAKKLDRSKLKSQAANPAELTQSAGMTGSFTSDASLAARIGSSTCRGMDGGALKTNQDYACFAQPFADIPGSSFFCVCDGHGLSGHDVSQEVLNSLLYELEHSMEEEELNLIDDPLNTIAEAFDAVNMHLRQMACEPEIEVNALESGACCVLAFAHDRTLYVGGVGDCRAVLGTRHEGALAAVSVSTDHKCDDPLERERIEEAGGRVQPHFTDEAGAFVPARLYESKESGKRGPGLCVSRTFGDLNAMHLGVIATPEMISHTLVDEDEYLILASDGVFEFLDNHEVVAIVDQIFQSGKPDPAQEACRFIIARSALQWKRHEGDYRDDITVIVVHLPSLIKTHSKELMRASLAEEAEEAED